MQLNMFATSFEVLVWAHFNESSEIKLYVLTLRLNLQGSHISSLICKGYLQKLDSSFQTNKIEFDLTLDFMGKTM